MDKDNTPVAINDAQFLAMVGAFAAVIGLVIIGYECFNWLRDGYWTNITFTNYIPKSPNINWANARGLEKIVDFLLGFDIGQVLLIGGGLLGMSNLNRLYGF